MFDLHSCRFDKSDLINEHEWVVKPDSLIAVSISQLPSCGKIVHINKKKRERERKEKLRLFSFLGTDVH